MGHGKHKVSPDYGKPLIKVQRTLSFREHYQWVVSPAGEVTPSTVEMCCHYR